jgi:hypothetical protein
VPCEVSAQAPNNTAAAANPINKYFRIAVVTP